MIVYAQDRSGRGDDGYYSKPDLGSALGIFFGAGAGVNSMDADGEDALTLHDAEAIFLKDRRVTFYTGAGEKVVISAQLST